jgi:DNA polymerase-3 subunit gamma/tau
MAFYQKYRPKTLEEIVGQDFVKETLHSAIDHNQVAHAYLFFGSRGTGKTSTARILAKALNCPNVKGGNPCNTCEFCLAADSGSFVDLIEIDGASNRKIEHARALIEKINFAPTLGKRKVYIIDEVHMLTREAFNALLKTIEEPPEHAFFLLATTELQKVPETIRSRCQVFTFQRFTIEQIADRLAKIAEREGFSAERDALELIAQKATGGLRDAIGLLEQSSVSGKVTVEFLQKELGLAGASMLAEFYEHLQQNKIEEALHFVERLGSEGLSLDEFTVQFLGFLREKMREYALSGSATGELAFVLRTIELFDAARLGLRDAPVPVFPLEIAIIRLLREGGESVSSQQLPTSSKQSASKSQQSTSNKEQGTEIKEQQPDSNQQTSVTGDTNEQVDVKGQGPESKEQEIGSREQTADSIQQSADNSEQPLMSSKQETASNNQLVASSPQSKKQEPVAAQAKSAEKKITDATVEHDMKDMEKQQPAPVTNNASQELSQDSVKGGLHQDSLRDDFAGLIKNISDVVLKASLMQAHAEYVSEHEFKVVFPSDSFRNQAESKERKAAFLAAVEQQFGSDVSVSFESKAVILEPPQAPRKPAPLDDKPITNPEVIKDIFKIQAA